jgi:adenylylsulfate kinase
MAIIWLTGQPSSGKTVLGKKLHNFLKTEKRNWRKDVFHLDGNELRELTSNKDYSKEGRIKNIKNAQMMAEYLHLNGCDVVVSLVAPYKTLRDEFKERIGKGDFQEIYLHTTEKRERDNFHTSDYQPPTEDFLDIDTTKDSPNISFSKIIRYLDENDKL